MSFYNKLRGRIREVYGSEVEFASALGISRAALSNKLNRQVDFKQSEMLKSCELLDIPFDQIHLFFYPES